jgi:hypothetical protein
VDRCALFVDAGYALADGAMAVHGTRRRDSVSWDHAGLLKLLAGLARDRTGLPVLRCYWYETAAESRRTPEHDALAEMPGLKLRLVNALPGRREGIESQLRRDLVTLAKSGAICDAFIASANEHIAEIVAEVQDLGLRVVILHIAADGGWTVPLPLRQECDDIVEISGVHLRSYVDLIKAEPAALPAAALPAPGVIYQVHDAGEYRQDYLSAPSHANAAGMGQSAGSSSAMPVAKETSQPGVSSQVSASAGPQPTASTASSGTQPYSTVGLPSGVYPTADQQNFAPAGAPADYQGGTGSYQNSSAGNYQNAAMQNGTGQPGTANNAANQAPVGNAGGQNGAVPNFDRQSGVSQNGTPHSVVGVAGSGGAGPHPAAANGTGQGGMSQDGARSADGQNGFPGDVGLNSLAAMGYQQQGAYQRGPGQNGPGQNGPGQNGPDQRGTGGPNGVGYQASGQNGVTQFGYSVGQHGQGANGIGQVDHAGGRGSGPAGYPAGQQTAPQGGALPGYQQSSAGPNGTGLPGQALPGQALPGQAQAGQQNQVPNGAAPAGYQAGPSSGVRGGAVQGGFQSAGQMPDPRLPDPRLPDPRLHDPRLADPRLPDPRLADPRQADPRQADPRPRDPYGPVMPPQMPTSLDATPMSAQPQYAFGAPDTNFAHGQPGAGPDQPQRAGFGPNPSGPNPLAGQNLAGQNLAGQNPGQGGAVLQPQYQMPQPPPPLPAVRVQQPVAMALPDAVKAAHAEGFTFGESVGRDAPGLWLEAVLARKPRMPSDLEARLLQGSVLPIDSLLHDEVRHSLRRGFWDALESARR